MKTIVELANEYQIALFDKRQYPLPGQDWRYVLVNQFGYEVGTKAILKITTQLAKKNLKPTWKTCIYFGSTASLTKYVPEILPSQVKLVLDFLKEQDRIIQIGKGKGVAIVLPLGYYPIANTFNPEPKQVPVNDPASMLGYLYDLCSDYDVVVTRLDKATEENVALRSEIEDLRAIVNSSLRTTWS